MNFKTSLLIAVLAALLITACAAPTAATTTPVAPSPTLQPTATPLPPTTIPPTATASPTPNPFTVSTALFQGDPTLLVEHFEGLGLGLGHRGSTAAASVSAIITIHSARSPEFDSLRLVGLTNSAGLPVDALLVKEANGTVHTQLLAWIPDPESSDALLAGEVNLEGGTLVYQEPTRGYYIGLDLGQPTVRLRLPDGSLYEARDLTTEVIRFIAETGVTVPEQWTVRQLTAAELNSYGVTNGLHFEMDEDGDGIRRPVIIATDIPELEILDINVGLFVAQIRKIGIEIPDDHQNRPVVLLLRTLTTDQNYLNRFGTVKSVIGVNSARLVLPLEQADGTIIYQLFETNAGLDDYISRQMVHWTVHGHFLAMLLIGTPAPGFNIYNTQPYLEMEERLGIASSHEAWVELSIIPIRYRGVSYDLSNEW